MHYYLLSRAALATVSFKQRGTVPFDHCGRERTAPAPKVEMPKVAVAPAPHELASPGTSDKENQQAGEQKLMQMKKCGSDSTLAGTKSLTVSCCA